MSPNFNMSEAPYRGHLQVQVGQALEHQGRFTIPTEPQTSSHLTDWSVYEQQRLEAERAAMISVEQRQAPQSIHELSTEQLIARVAQYGINLEDHRQWELANKFADER